MKPSRPFVCTVRVRVAGLAPVKRNRFIALDGYCPTLKMLM